MSDSGTDTIRPVVQQYLEIIFGCKRNVIKAIKSWPTFGVGRRDRFPEQSLLKDEVRDRAIGGLCLVGPCDVAHQI